MAINLKDYTRTAAQRGWGAGWPSCSGVKTAGTAVVTAAKSGTRFSVHKRIARLVSLLVDETERRGYLLKPGQCGGYNCRNISGTNSPSNHSWGLAVDINWNDNPMRRPLTTNIPEWMVHLWNRYGFAWGGHYTTTPDPMHFEFMGTPSDADQMTAFAIQELGTPTGGFLMSLTPDEQRELLARVRNLDYQLVHGEGDEQGRWGWRTWPGGTNETLTVVDYLRRNNVEVRTVIAEVQALRAAISALSAALAQRAGGSVSAAEIKQAVAEAIRENIVQVDVQVKGK